MYGQELLITGRKAARNMYSHNTNKIGIQCVCWFYLQGVPTVLPGKVVFPLSLQIEACSLEGISLLFHCLTHHLPEAL